MSKFALLAVAVLVLCVSDAQAHFGVRGRTVVRSSPAVVVQGGYANQGVTVVNSRSGIFGGRRQQTIIVGR